MGFADWLKKSKQGLGDAVKRFNNRGFMDASMAACALIAAADGDISSDEKQKTAGFIKLNDALKTFDLNTCIERFEEYAGMLEFDYGVGKDACLDAVKKVSNSPEQAQLVVRLSCAIGGADGDFDDDEKQTVREICGVLGLAPSKFNL